MGFFFLHFNDLNCNGILVIVVEINTVIQVQILHEAVCLSYTANTIKKLMNPTLFQSKRKYVV